MRRREHGDSHGFWESCLFLIAVAVYVSTWRGFGPIGQPKDSPFPIWPQVSEYLRREIFSSQSRFMVIFAFNNIAIYAI